MLPMGCLITAFVLYIRFVCGAITEICDHLGIHCFKVKEKTDQPTLTIGTGKKKDDATAAKSPTGTNC